MRQIQHLKKMLNLTLFMLLSLTCNLAFAVAIGVNPPQQPNIVWVPGHWSHGHWVEGYYTELPSVPPGPNNVWIIDGNNPKLQHMPGNSQNRK